MLIRAARPIRLSFRSPLKHRRAMSSFQLDKNIFNATLYKKLRDVWLSGQPLDAREIDPSILERWFPKTDEAKVAFDGICRDNFGHALEAIGPQKLPNPTAEPFIQEIREVAQQNPDDNGAEAAWTALSIVVLLDQIPRNLYRTKSQGLAKVYNHYDKISYPLIMNLFYSPDSPVKRPDLHPQWQNSVAFRQWFYLPLIHSEEIEAHDRVDELMKTFHEYLEKNNGSEQMKKFSSMGLQAEKEHRDILDKFGRYPHRNSSLGRKSTPEELKFLAEGGATFGVAQEKESE